MKFGSWLLSILFPKSCLNCGKFGRYFCDGCMDQFKYLKYAQCPKCAKFNRGGYFCSLGCKKGYFFDRIIICSHYQRDGPIKKLIWHFKYRFIEEIGETLAIFLEQSLRRCIRDVKREIVIVPVPIDSLRMNFRGFNHCQKLAKLLVKNFADFNVTMLDCLIKKVSSEPQANLSRERRLKNLKGKFELQHGMREKIAGKLVIILDDVFTTGSTLNETAKVLKMAGVKEIWGLVLAKA